MTILEATFPSMIRAIPGRDEDMAPARPLDSAALAQLVDQYAGTLYRVAYSVVRHAEDAEDVVQETYIRVLRSAGKLQEIRDARVWLIRIAWNLSLDRKRRRKTGPVEDDATLLMARLPAHDLPADQALAADQGHARLLRMMDSLPAKERQVLLLSALQELSTAEIASILKTTESTVRSRLFRARQRMRERLETDRADLEATNRSPNTRNQQGSGPQ